MKSTASRVVWRRRSWRSSSGSISQRVGPSASPPPPAGRAGADPQPQASDESRATLARRQRGRMPPAIIDPTASLQIKPQSGTGSPRSSVHAVAADRFRRFLDRPERLLVTLQIGGESADDALEVARTGDDPGGHDALRRSQVDEVEDELLARVGDAEQ